MSGTRLLSSSVFRYSLRQLLVATALVALACVALRNASPAWVAGLMSLVLLLLAAALPLAILRDGATRAWWFGFGLFGGLYMLLLAYSWSLDPSSADHNDNPLRPGALLTTRLSRSGYERLFASVDTAATDQFGAVKFRWNADGKLEPLPPGPPGNTNPSRSDFVNVAHALWALLLAIVGGWFTRWVYATRRASKAAA
jgi:hypothetical protein